MTGQLHDAAVWCEVAPESAHPAGLLEWAVDRSNHALALALGDGARDLAERPAVDVQRIRGDEAPLSKLARDQRDTAGLVHVVCGELAGRLEVGKHGRARDDLIEVPQV